MPHIIEGTWDEIKQHESEFACHRLLVIIDPEENLAADIPVPPFAVTNQEQLADLLTEAVERLDGGRGIEATPEYWDRKQQRVIDRLGPA
jgi:hypothetical protein